MSIHEAGWADTHTIGYPNRRLGRCDVHSIYGYTHESQETPCNCIILTITHAMHNRVVTKNDSIIAVLVFYGAV